MKKILFILIAFFLQSCVTATSYYSKSDKYVTFKGLPCSFNGVQVKGINNAATLGKKTQNCCPSCKGYKSKKGQTLHVKRGTPVLAIADMTLITATNRSAKQRTGRSGRQNTNFSVSKPYDDLKLLFEDKYGNYIIYYHLMSDNPFVPGFGKGKCTIPLEFQTEREKRNAFNCGGYVKRDVKKGEFIGYVGSTGGRTGDHISLGIDVNTDDPRFKGKSGLVVPSHNFTWENKPTNDPLKYLLPIK
ncbi:hypothetical protein ABXT66_07100 [Candidatus Levibacter sp. Uisw_134_01]|jgi:hypothetical protein|uniref:hypothetical protein n=1 Tax=Candidatus Levibacter sp. Uisw_134_01 TaxID=3230999 RepID=UPI003D445B2C